MTDLQTRLEAKPITDADIPAVAEFLHRCMSSRMPAAKWRQVMTAPWEVEQPNHGYLLHENGRIVGAFVALYSERLIDDRPRRICNLGVWCVAEEHRAHGLRLVRALLRQRGYTFTDLSPSAAVVSLNTRLGFAPLDTSTSVVPNVPWPKRSSGVRILDSPIEIDQLLSGPELTIYRDHLATAVHHVLLVKGEQRCYVVYRRERRRGLNRFAWIVYVSNPATFRECAAHFHRYLLLRRGIVATLAEDRVLGYRPKRAVRMAGSPKMFLSEDLEASQIDYLYSELTCRPW